MRSNKLLKELMEMGGMDDMSDMGDMDMSMDSDGDGEPDGKKFIDKEEAANHAKEFLERANEVLQYNKKEATDDEVCKLATQYAKDYYEAIVEELNAQKYTGRKEAEEGM